MLCLMEECRERAIAMGDHEVARRIADVAGRFRPHVAIMSSAGPPDPVLGRNRMRPSNILASLDGCARTMHGPAFAGNRAVVRLGADLEGLVAEIARRWSPVKYHRYEDFPLEVGFDRWARLWAGDSLDLEILRKDYEQARA